MYHLGRDGEVDVDGPDIQAGTVDLADRPAGTGKSTLLSCIGLPEQANADMVIDPLRDMADSGVIIVVIHSAQLAKACSDTNELE